MTGTPKTTYPDGANSCVFCCSEVDGVHDGTCPLDAREFCGCGEMRDDFGACWQCDRTPCDAAMPVVLCPRCTDDAACDDHEVRS